MNIKLDENLPERLVAELSALGHDVDTVRTERLAGRDDTEPQSDSWSRRIWTSPTFVGTRQARTPVCCWSA